jgi:hypothetical protein
MTQYYSSDYNFYSYSDHEFKAIKCEKEYTKFSENKKFTIQIISSIYIRKCQTMS